MNRKVLIGTTVGVLAVGAAGYVGTSWYIGKRLETQLTKNLGELRIAHPELAISDTTIHRGIFSTQHDIAFGINPDCLGAIPAQQKSDVLNSAQSFKVHFRHTVQHGPLLFTDGVKLGMASYQGSLFFNENVAQKLKAVIGDQSLLSWNGDVQFTGDHQFRISSPKFEIKEKNVQISWSGLTGTGSGNVKDESYKMNLIAPKLIAQSTNTPANLSANRSAMGVMGEITNMSMVAEGRKGPSGLGIGTASFGIDTVKVVDAAQVEQVALSGLRIASDVKENNGLMDIGVSYQIANLAMEGGQEKIGPIVFDIGLNHLHAPSLMSFSKSMSSVTCAKPEQMPALLEKNMAQWKELFVTLLKNKPTFSLKQVRLVSPNGELNAKGSISLNDFDPAILDNPQTAMLTLPQAINAEFEGAATEKLLIGFLKDFVISRNEQQLQQQSVMANLAAENTTSPPSPPTPPTLPIAPTAEQLEQLQGGAEEAARQQLQMAVTQNFARLEGDQYKVNFTLNNGQAMLNGAPFNLPSAQQPVGQPSMAMPSMAMPAPAVTPTPTPVVTPAAPPQKAVAGTKINRP